MNTTLGDPGAKLRDVLLKGFLVSRLLIGRQDESARLFGIIHDHDRIRLATCRDPFALYPAYARIPFQPLHIAIINTLSTQTHHSVIKAARLCGLGSRAIRFVEVDADLKMDANALKRLIERDLVDGWNPFMVIGTVGTTNAGVIDPIGEIAKVAKSHDTWFHIDAAWGGGAALFAPEICEEFGNMRSADSITFDAHKWMSVPMAAGMYLTTHQDILRRTFSVQAEYMSGEAEVPGIPDPYANSLQWSRRFIGLKVFMSLAVAGWDGYREVIMRQIELGDLLREELHRSGWTVVNRTPLPVICFTDDTLNKNTNGVLPLKDIADEIVKSGEAWISCTRLSPELEVLRACITNSRSREFDTKHLIAVLTKVRKMFRHRSYDPAYQT